MSTIVSSASEGWVGTSTEDDTGDCCSHHHRRTGYDQPPGSLPLLGLPTLRPAHRPAITPPHWHRSSSLPTLLSLIWFLSFLHWCRIVLLSSSSSPFDYLFTFTISVQPSAPPHHILTLIIIHRCVPPALWVLSTSLHQRGIPDTPKTASHLSHLRWAHSHPVWIAGWEEARNQWGIK